MRNAPPRTLLTLAVGAVGAGLAITFLLPLPLLLGPLFACLLAALLGAPLGSMPKTTATLRTVLGVAAGASITPQLLEHIGDYALAIALVLLLTALIAACGVPWYRRCGFDRPTAFYAAMPGGLQDMLLFGLEAGANPRALSLAHATRLSVVVTTLPFLLTGWLDLTLTQSPGAPASEFSLLQLGLLAVCALGGWWLGRVLKLPGASILGPLLLTAALSLAGVIEQRPPSEAILAAQFFIGIGVGVHYVGISTRELRQVVSVSLGFCVIAGTLTAGMLWLVSSLSLVPSADALLAFAPGGQAEMTVLAIVAGAELSFVVTLHVARIVFVILGAPLAQRWYSSKQTDER